MFSQKIKKHSFSEFLNLKVIDGHFVFEFPNISKKHIYSHCDWVCDSNYDSLKLTKNFSFEKVLKKFIFEFRQLPPSLIKELRKIRKKQEDLEDIRLNMIIGFKLKRE